MTKRIIATILASLLLLTLFVGCSSNNTASTTAAATTAAAAETTAAAAETTAAAAETTAAETTAAATTAAPLEDCDLYVWMGGEGIQKDTNEVFGVVSEKVAEAMPGTNLILQNFYFSDFKEKYYKALAAGEVIDLAWQGWKFNLTSEIADGNIIPIDEYIEEYGQDIIAFYGEDVIDLHRNSSDNLLYFVPAYQGLLSGKYPLVLRQTVSDLFTEEEKAEMCATWKAGDYDPSDEATRAIYDIETEILRRARENNVFGSGTDAPVAFTDFTSGDSNWRYAYYTVGVYTHINYGDDTYTVVPNMTSEPAVTRYEYAANWYTNNLVPQETDEGAGCDWYHGEDSWAFQVTGVIGYADPETMLSETWGVDIDIWEIGGPEQVWPGWATGTAVPFTTKNPERAMMFLNLLFTDAGKDIYRTYVFGLEGKHWDYVSADDKDTIDLYTGSGDPSPEWDYGNPCWTIGTATSIFTTSFASPDLYWSYHEEEATAYVPFTQRFGFDSTNVGVEEAQIGSIRGEYSAVLYGGSLGLDGWEAYYNEYAEKLIAAGIETYTAEVQTQLNDFIARTGVSW